MANALGGNHRLRLLQHRPHRQQEIIAQHLTHRGLMKVLRILAKRRQRLLHKAPQRHLVLLFDLQRRLVTQHMQHPLRVMQEAGLAGNDILRDHYAQNGVIIRRAELKLGAAGSGGDFGAAEAL